MLRIRIEEEKPARTGAAAASPAAPQSQPVFYEYDRDTAPPWRPYYDPSDRVTRHSPHPPPPRCEAGRRAPGALATFLHWALTLSSPPASPVLAAWAAARLARGCGEAAFRQAGRAATTSDMIANIHEVFNRLYEGETSL